MNFITELILKFRDILKNSETRTDPPESRTDQQHVMSEDEKLDQAIDESFPASDPPGHFSKSAEDLKQY